jgi:hypothetical protein
VKLSNTVKSTRKKIVLFANKHENNHKIPPLILQKQLDLKLKFVQIDEKISKFVFEAIPVLAKAENPNKENILKIVVKSVKEIKIIHKQRIKV